MSFTRKILPALALVGSLAPPAAQAAPQTVLVDPITPSNATIDQPTTIYCGGVRAFPESFGANSKMSFSKKLLPVLTLLVSMGAFSAQAHNVKHDEVMQSAKSWVTNFGFLPIDVSHCTDVQTSFWPRPLECK